MSAIINKRYPSNFAVIATVKEVLSVRIVEAAMKDQFLIKIKTFPHHHSL